jgi:hypothetical protein
MYGREIWQQICEPKYTAFANTSGLCWITRGWWWLCPQVHLDENEIFLWKCPLHTNNNSQFWVGFEEPQWAFKHSVSLFANQYELSAIQLCFLFSVFFKSVAERFLLTEPKWLFHHHWLLDQLFVSLTWRPKGLLRTLRLNTINLQLCAQIIWATRQDLGEYFLSKQAETQMWLASILMNKGAQHVGWEVGMSEEIRVCKKCHCISSAC